MRPAEQSGELEIILDSPLSKQRKKKQVLRGLLFNKDRASTETYPRQTGNQGNQDSSVYAPTQFE